MNSLRKTKLKKKTDKQKLKAYVTAAEVIYEEMNNMEQLGTDREELLTCLIDVYAFLHEKFSELENSMKEAKRKPKKQKIEKRKPTSTKKKKAGAKKIGKKTSKKKSKVR